MLSTFMKRLLFARQLDIQEGKVMILGVKHSCLPISFLNELHNKHPSEISKILKSNIKEEMKKYSKAIGTKEENMFKNAPDIFEIYGLGKLEINDYDKVKKKAIIRVKNVPIECKKDSCMTSSIISGMFSSILKKDVDAKSNKCIAKGDQYCEFIVK